MPFLMEVTGYELTYSNRGCFESAPIAGLLAGQLSNSHGSVLGVAGRSSEPVMVLADFAEETELPKGPGNSTGT